MQMGVANSMHIAVVNSFAMQMVGSISKCVVREKVASGKCKNCHRKNGFGKNGFAHHTCPRSPVGEAYIVAMGTQWQDPRKKGTSFHTVQNSFVHTPAVVARARDRRADCDPAGRAPVH
jgi:hypothetical protein